jgi:hypothetical protein
MSEAVDFAIQNLRAGKLIGVRPSGEVEWIVSDFPPISHFINGTIDLSAFSKDAAYYIDDNGMVEGLRLNVPASVFAGHPYYGPVVLCHREPDREGNRLPPPDDAAMAILAVAQSWREVLKGMERVGQTFDVCANPDTVPSAQIIELTPEKFDRWLGGEDIT